MRRILTVKELTALTGLAALMAASVVHAGALADLSAFYYKAAGSPTVTAVIPPGYELKIGGKRTLVSGRNECPKHPVPPSSYLWWMGGNEVSGPGCVVVGPLTAQVSVDLYGVSGERTAETWKVVRTAHNDVPAFALQRLNGEYVAQTK